MALTTFAIGIDFAQLNEGIAAFGRSMQAVVVAMQPLVTAVGQLQQAMIKVVGDLDMGQVEALREALDKAAREPGALVILPEGVELEWLDADGSTCSPRAVTLDELRARYMPQEVVGEPDGSHRRAHTVE